MLQHRNNASHRLWRHHGVHKTMFTATDYYYQNKKKIENWLSQFVKKLS